MWKAELNRLFVIYCTKPRVGPCCEALQQAQRSAHAGLLQVAKLLATETFKSPNDTHPPKGRWLHSAKASKNNFKSVPESSSALNMRFYLLPLFEHTLKCAYFTLHIERRKKWTPLLPLSPTSSQLEGDQQLPWRTYLIKKHLYILSA